MNFKNSVSIIWSPNGESKFVKVNSKSIDLYEVTRDTEPRIHKIQSFTDNEIRSVAWHISSKDSNFKSPKDLLAIGYNNGSIRITSLSGSSVDNEDEYNLVETKLRPNKVPGFLTWNPYMKHFMAQGIDKTKGSWNNEASLIVWEFKGPNSFTPGNFTKSNQSGSTYHDALNQSKLTGDNVTTDVAFSGYCKAEVVNSLAWTPDRHLICGVNNKYLKLFDLQSVNPLKMVSSDAVYGLCCEYNNNKHIASFVDDRIVLWSEKNLDTPVSTLLEYYPIESIEWSPFGDGYVCVVFRERSYVKIINTNIALRNTVRCQHHLIDQTIETYSTITTVVTAVWHQTLQNCLLIYNSLDQFELHFIHNRLSVSVSIDQNIMMTYGDVIKNCYKIYPETDEDNRAMSPPLSGISNIQSNILQRDTLCKNTNFSCAFSYDEDECKPNEDVDSVDIDVLMNDEAILFKQRALDYYGQKSISDKYSTMFEDNRDLYLFWKWIEDTHKSNSKLHMKNQNNQYLGIIDGLKEICEVTISRDPNSGYSRPLFARRPNLHGSKPEQVRWNKVDDILSFPKYTHSFRDKIFSVTGWPFNTPLEKWRFILDELEDQERAAAIAMVTLNFEVSLQYFRRLSSPEMPQEKTMEYDILRLCLSGFNTQVGNVVGYQVNPMWLMTCRDVLKSLGDDRPYLSLIFQFLTVTTVTHVTPQACRQDLEGVLKSENIQLNDKLAIAALYFDDDSLIDYCNSLSDKYLLGGYLEGVVLTGLHSKDLFHDILLQNYVDKTFDIQTAAIAVLQAVYLTKSSSSQLIHSASASCWIETYRSLLDIWKFWFIRSDFDCANYCFPYDTAKGLLLNPQTSPTPATGSGTAPGKGPGSVPSNKGVGVGKNKKPAASMETCEVYVACYYCGVKVAQPTKFIANVGNRRNINQNKPPTVSGVGTGGGAGATPGAGSSNTGYHGKTADMHSGGCKATICQNCRKPLPRCAVCLMNMDVSSTNMSCNPSSTSEGMAAFITNNVIPANIGASTATGGGTTTKNTFGSGFKWDEGPPLPISKRYNLDELPVNPMLPQAGPLPTPTNPISTWFMWCQTCKHGGHAGHLAEWFQKSPECPVANCRCLCISLDQSDAIIAQNQQSSQNDDSSLL